MNNNLEKVLNLINNIQKNIESNNAAQSNALQVLIGVKQQEILNVLANELSQNKDYYFEVVKEEKEKK